MSTPEIIIWAVVLVVGASWWHNPTAGALALSWLCGQMVYLATGDNLAVEFYLLPDIFVLAIIFGKQEHRAQSPYRNAWHQLKCIVLERTPADRVVMLIFPVMWVLYAADLHPYHKWWALYYLVLAQFLAAGLESLSTYRRAYSAASDTPETTSGDECRVAWECRGYG